MRARLREEKEPAVELALWVLVLLTEGVLRPLALLLNVMSVLGPNCPESDGRMIVLAVGVLARAEETVGVAEPERGGDGEETNVDEDNNWEPDPETDSANVLDCPTGASLSTGAAGVGCDGGLG